MNLAMLPGTVLTLEQMHAIQRAYLVFELFNRLDKAVLHACLRRK